MSTDPQQDMHVLMHTSVFFCSFFLYDAIDGPSPDKYTQYLDKASVVTVYTVGCDARVVTRSHVRPGKKKKKRKKTCAKAFV